MFKRGMKKFCLFVCIVLLGFIFFHFSFVQAAPPDLGLKQAAATGLATTDIRIIIARVIRAVLGLLGIIVLGFILYGGFVWMTAGGDTNKIDKAKKILTNSVIGLLIVLASFSITNFIISKLHEATTGGGGLQQQGVGAGIGGGIIGSGNVNVFRITSISPTGKLPIRNIEVEIVFSNNVDKATVNSSNIIIQKIDKNTKTKVSGTFNVNGNVVTFVPDQNCPPPNSNRKCFDKNSKYSIEVVNGSIKDVSTPQKTLNCLFGSSCKAEFETGDKVDTQKPNVYISYPINAMSVCGKKSKIVAVANDDVGVKSVEFFEEKQGKLNSLPNPVVNKKQGDLFNAITFWDVTRLKPKQGYKIYALVKDLDSNQAKSSFVSVISRAEHCCNNKKDADELGVDCGGNDCGACLGASCVQNSDCSTGLCIQGKCVEQPVILGFNPSKVSSRSFVTIQGVGFGQKPGTVSLISIKDKKSFTASLPQNCNNVWSNRQIVFEVPSGLGDGDYIIKVETSNINPQTKQPFFDDTQNNRGIKKNLIIDKNAKVPGICELKPASGKFNQKFDIIGRNLSSAEKVFLGKYEISSSGAVTNDLIKDLLVPNLQPGILPVYVQTKDKRVSNSLDFEILSSPDAPFISNISPNRGNSGQYISIIGKNFGNSQAKVLFLNPKDPKDQGVNGDFSFPQECANGFWSDNQIFVKVPQNLTNGDYKVVVETAIGRSNTFDFKKTNDPVTPGICKIDPIQGPVGLQVNLYGDNFDRQTNLSKVNFYKVGLAKPNSAFIKTWKNNFVSILVPKMQNGSSKVQLVDGNGTLSNKVNFVVGSCLNNNNSCPIKNTQCCGDGSCRPACPPTPKSSHFMWRFSTSSLPPLEQIPEVVEQQCKWGIKNGIKTLIQEQSPSPYLDSQNACSNAMISARFNIPMDKTSFSNNIYIYKCQTPDKCSSQSLPIQSISDIRGKGNKVYGFRVSLSNSLQANSLYKVLLKAGSKGIRSEKGKPMAYDYLWFFKVSNKCVLENVAVSPGNPLLEELNQIQTLTALPLAANCNSLDPNKYQWSWSIHPIYFDKVIFAPPSKQPAEAFKKNIQAKGETGKNPVPVTATAVKEKKSGNSLVEVKFKDPQVISYWPNCQAACINASIGAEFNVKLNASTVNKNTVKVFYCKNDSCLIKDLQKINLRSIQVKDNKIFISLQNNLTKNSFYRVILDGNIQSSSNVKLSKSGVNYDLDLDGKNDSFSWVFKTKNTKEVCKVSRVGVLPVSYTVNKIGEKKDYLSIPYSLPDECSSSGQRLDPYSYEWQWSSLSPKRAVIYSYYKVSNNLPSYCSSNCLKTGSTYYKAICGNGIVEKGEDCDDGNTTDGDGCSSVCLNEGTKFPICGNDKLDPGEDCDYSARKNLCVGGKRNGKSCTSDADCVGDKNAKPPVKDGKCLAQVFKNCSSQCLNMGNQLTCGDGKLDEGEDCDDGNTTDGDGCSSICLNEGSTKKTSIIAVCGNGKIEQGEDCDEGGICVGGKNNGKVCHSNADCIIKDGRFTKEDGYCKPQIVGVCSERCLFIGAKTSCGNGKVEKQRGEQCDDGNKIDGDGCSSNCLLEGSSYSYDKPSLCGNSVLETGEACEVSKGSLLKGGPYTWVTAKDFIPDKPKSILSTAKIKSKIIQQNVSGSGDFILRCGYTADSQCGNYIEQGVGKNTCCFARPKVAENLDPAKGLVLYPKNNEQNVCTNTLIKIPFDQKMEAGSFTGNVLLLELTNNKVCLNKSKPLTIENQNWCISSVTIEPTLDLSQQLLLIKLNNLLKDNTWYRIVLKGDSNLQDNKIEGLTSVNIVSFAGQKNKTLTLDKKQYHIYSWKFKTKTRCSLYSVDIKNSDPKDNEPFIYRKANLSKNYLSIAKDNQGREIQSIPNVYEWKWNWVATPKDLYIKKQASKNQAEIQSTSKNGKGILKAEAYIEEVRFGADSVCYQNSECKSNVCLDKNNALCSGNSCGDSKKKTGHCRVSVVGVRNLETFICNNPWPPQQASQRTASFENQLYNFSLRYCRDAGISKVCRGSAKDNGKACNSDEDCDIGSGSKCVLFIDDDLPKLKIPQERRINGKICVGGTNTNNTCKTDADCGGGLCKDTLLLTEYIFTLEKEQKVCHNLQGTTNNIFCSSDSDCSKADKNFPYCYADLNQNLQSFYGNGIGIRVMKNLQHYSPGLWYEKYIQSKIASSPSQNIDGYHAVRAGRTIYVNAVNVTKEISKSFYTNIYLMSYNQNAKSETLNIYNQLLNSWTFNINLSPSVKRAVQRDTYRLEDLHTIANALEDYKSKFGYYPKLESGTYIKGMSFSTWNSWQDTLGLELNRALPIDPSQKDPEPPTGFKACPGFNEVTCWNSEKLEFDTRLFKPNTKELGPGSYVYQYYTPDEGKTYSLFYNIEFLGLDKKIGGRADQCYDDKQGQWVNNGTCYSGGKKICVLGTWQNSCGNGKVDCGEKCEIGDVINFCQNNVGVCVSNGKITGQSCLSDGDCSQGVCNRLQNISWNKNVIQRCNSSCELEPTTNSLLQKYTADPNNFCGGFCGDRMVNGSEQCDGNVSKSCKDLGWGDQGKVGCTNQCKYYGGGCINGPLSEGDVRVMLQWSVKDFSGNRDLDLYLLLPNNTVIGTYNVSSGNINSTPFAWATSDDTCGVNCSGPDFNNDGQADGLEMITWRKNPKTGKYLKGVYKVIVHDYNFFKPECFAGNCEIRVLVQQKENGKLKEKLFRLEVPNNLSKLGSYWHVFNFDFDNGLVFINKFLEKRLF